MKDFKVGQRVTCLRRGRGTIKEITTTGQYPISVAFKSDDVETYTKEGRYAYDDSFPTLLHGWFDTISITTHYNKRKKKGADDATDN